MRKRQQLNIDYKLQAPASKNIDNLLIKDNSHEQSDNTPVWRSVAPESQHQSIKNNGQEYFKILDKLNKLDEVDMAKSTYSKVRMGSSGYRASDKKQTQILYTEERCDKENQHIQRMSYSRNDKDKAYQRLKSTRNKTDSRVVTGQSLISQNNSTRAAQSRINTKRNDTERGDSGQKQKKFNNITVHQYLYLDSKKLQNKRLIEQILDEEYKKKNILTFKPTISQKSQQLAVIKFGKIQQRQSLEQELEEELRSLSMQIPQPKITNSQIQRRKQQHKYLTLRQFFDMLSQNKKAINKNTIKEVIEEVPLVCIKIIAKIIEKIYQGKQYSWLQFLSAVNDKKMVNNKEGLLSVTEKWLSKEAKQSDRDTKEETIVHQHL